VNAAKAGSASLMTAKEVVHNVAVSEAFNAPMRICFVLMILMTIATLQTVVLIVLVFANVLLLERALLMVPVVNVNTEFTLAVMELSEAPLVDASLTPRGDASGKFASAHCEGRRCGQ